MQRFRRYIFDGLANPGADAPETDKQRAFATARSPHLKPEEIAPTAGVYAELNVFGTPTGNMVDVCEGEPMPRAPVGFSWRPEMHTPKWPPR
jgi:hypothetical protein